MFNEICFPPHEGLPFEPGPPKVDGYVEPDPGLNPVAQLEAGYTRGARFTFEEGGGSGVPLVVFTGVKDSGKDILYLGFVVRFDFSFDNNDRIVLFLRPDAATVGHTTDERRIDIMPLFSAGIAGGPSGGGANASPADPKDDPSVGLRTNKEPRDFDVFRRNAVGAAEVWQDMTATMKNLSKRVRSSTPSAGVHYWSVEIGIPTKKGSGANEGGDDWIDLTLAPSFGLYLNVIRVCSGGGCGGAALGGDFATQSTWPFDLASPTAFYLVDPAVPIPANWDIDPTWFGKANLLAPGAANPCKGVKFQNGVLSIGNRKPGNSIVGTVDMTLGADNTIVARVVNTDSLNPAPQVNAEFRIADFGLGPYGNQALWGKLPGRIVVDPANPVGPNPTAPQNIPISGATVDLTMPWKINAADRTKYTPLWNDQCLWALLDSAGGANIAEASMRRNLSLQNLSDAVSSFTVSGEGYDPPADGSTDQDIILHSAKVRQFQRKNLPPARGEELPNLGASNVRGDHGEGNEQATLELSPLITGDYVGDDPGKQLVTWLHVTNGYRRTGMTLTIESNKYTLFHHIGSFTYLPRHELERGETPENVDLDVQFSGGGIEVVSDGLHRVRVPDGGKVRVNVRLSTTRRDEGGEDGTDGKDDLKSVLRCLLKCLRGILRFLLRLIRKLFGK